MDTPRIIAMLLFLCGHWSCGKAEMSVDCGPTREARESESHTITCSGLDPDPNNNVTWRFVFGNAAPVTVGECTGNMCWEMDNGRYDIRRNGSISTVRVKNVTRTGSEVLGEWRCQQAGAQTQCLVTQVIYPARVNNNQCSVAFNESSKLVTARCAILKSYPPASCKWFYNREGYSIQDVKGSDTSTTFSPYQDSQTGQIYYTGECRIHEMPLPTDEGAYVFRVHISPGGTEPDVDFTTTNVIEHPWNPQLQDCNTAWIDLDRAEGGQVICKCTTPQIGSPPGHLLLQHPNGTLIKSSPRDPIPLHIRDVSLSDSEKNFPCIVRHHTGDRTAYYAPKLAYGPSQVFITKFNSENENTLLLKCFSVATNPQPDIQWHFEGDASKITIGETIQDGSYYIRSLTIEIEDSDKGKQVQCVGKNPQRENSEKNAEPFVISGQATGYGAAGDGYKPRGALSLVLLCLVLCCLMLK